MDCKSLKTILSLLKTFIRIYSNKLSNKVGNYCLKKTLPNCDHEDISNIIECIMNNINNKIYVGLR